MNIVGKRALCLRKQCQFLSSQYVSRRNLYELFVTQRCVLYTSVHSYGPTPWSAVLADRAPHYLRRWTCTDERAHSQGTTLSERDFELVCEETLDSLNDVFEDLAESDLTSDDYDVLFANGVITVQMGSGHGTYVINKQTPNKQIWLSSPISGPKRYDFKEGTWIYKHDGVSLHDTLTMEVSSMLGQQLSFSACAYGIRQKTSSS